MHAELVAAPYQLTRAQVVGIASRPDGDQALSKVRADLSTLLSPTQNERASGTLRRDGRWEPHRFWR